MRNVLLVLEYDGTDYYGFQKQPALPTIQGVVEKALSKLTGEEIHINGCSRTDAGAHATAQVVNFQTENPIPVERVCSALNGLLPLDVAAVQAQEVHPGFQARYCARNKTYIYNILNKEPYSPFLARIAFYYPRQLSIEAMNQAAKSLVGSHDFVAFSAKDSGEDSGTVREMKEVRCWREGPLIRVLVRANGFLYRMVRIIVGTLLQVGELRRPVTHIPQILESKDRSKAGPAVDVRGLCLVEVQYNCEHLSKTFGRIIP